MRVHSFESLAALEGDGIRFDIFLAGCPLRCVYCHNPDTWNMESGEVYTTEQLLKKIRRYKPYFRASGGGVTFSGGEPLLQAGEIAELGAALTAEGITYDLDTSGCVSLHDDVKQAVAGADLVILDLKFPTEEGYRDHIHGDISLVKKFLAHLYEEKKRIWVRTVIVPGLNDSEKMLDRYLDFLAPFQDGIERYELLAFHTMGFFKYEKLGITNPLADKAALPQDRLAALQAYADAQFC